MDPDQKIREIDTVIHIVLSLAVSLIKIAALINCDTYKMWDLTMVYSRGGLECKGVNSLIQ